MLTSRWTKAALFVLCLVPFFWLGWAAYKNDLGANPIEYITHATGDWTLRFLAISLSAAYSRPFTGSTSWGVFRH